MALIEAEFMFMTQSFARGLLASTGCPFAVMMKAAGTESTTEPAYVRNENRPEGAT